MRVEKCMHVYWFTGKKIIEFYQKKQVSLLGVVSARSVLLCLGHALGSHVSRKGFLINVSVNRE